MFWLWFGSAWLWMNMFLSHNKKERERERDIIQWYFKEYHGSFAWGRTKISFIFELICNSTSRRLFSGRSLDFRFLSNSWHLWWTSTPSWQNGDVCDTTENSFRTANKSDLKHPVGQSLLEVCQHWTKGFLLHINNAFIFYFLHNLSLNFPLDNHVCMVHRMIGSKGGTGGSSGYQYLRSTVR